MLKDVFKEKKMAEVIQEDFKYRIPDEYWEHVHRWYADNLKHDPVDTERHINFKVQDATLISSREEVERQHKAWHDRQRTKYILQEKK
jgi:hypothetical protein